MKKINMYARYIFLMAFFLSDVSLISADIHHNENVVVTEDAINDSVSVPSAAPTIAWYRHRMVKNVLIGATIVSMGTMIIVQKIIIDELARAAREASVLAEKAVFEAHETLVSAEKAKSEYTETIARLKNTIPAVDKADVNPSNNWGLYFFMGTVGFALLGNSW